MSDERLQARAPYAISEPRYTVAPQVVTTAFDLPCCRARRSLGVVRVAVGPLEGASIYEP